MQLDDSDSELEALYESILGSLDVSEADDAVDTSVPEIEILDHVGDIFKQRKEQRKTVLSFIRHLTIAITVFFIAMVAINMTMSFFVGRSLVSDSVLSVIAVSFFAETIAVMHSITKELWHEDGILAAPVVQKLADGRKKIKK